MSKCRACSESIRFVTNEATQRRIPVDPAPDEDGSVVARRALGYELLGRVLTKGEDVPDGWSRFMPHFATCRARQRRRGAPRPLTLFDP